MKIKIYAGFVALALLSTLNSKLSTVFAQGSLTPSGAPAPTMRTLLQIEPRTPISILPYTISTSGSYYLTTNLTGVAESNGIIIAASGVKVDLMGFTLNGVSGSGDGVSVPAGQVNVVVENGNLEGWGGYGVNGTNASNSRLERVSAFNNTSGGMAIGNGSAINDCQAISNLWHGISLGNGSSAKGCSASANGGLGHVASGVTGGNNVVITGCTAMLNYGWGIQAGNDSAISICTGVSNNESVLTGYGGILAGNGSTISGCTANNNLVLFSANGDGIVTGNYCIVKGCTASHNNHGIWTGYACNVEDCVAYGNAISVGIGILVGDGSVVRGCVAESNAYGGINYGNSCFVVDNLAQGNTFNGYPEIGGSGSHSTVIHNTIGSTNAFFANNNVTNNAIGTVESAASLNANKDPHANFNP